MVLVFRYFFNIVGGFFIGGVIGAALTDPADETSAFFLFCALLGAFLGALNLKRAQKKKRKKATPVPTPAPAQTYIDNRRVYNITSANPGDAQELVARLEQQDPQPTPQELAALDMEKTRDGFHKLLPGKRKD